MGDEKEKISVGMAMERLQKFLIRQFHTNLAYIYKPHLISVISHPAIFIREGFLSYVYVFLILYIRISNIVYIYLFLILYIPISNIVYTYF